MFDSKKMKKYLMTIIFILGFLPNNCFAIFQKEIHWDIEGPGGTYGVLSYDTRYINMEYSYILLGPIQFQVPLEFEATRILFICILLFPVLLIILGVILPILNKRREIERGRST